jgi:uncharacterized membrane protein YciS (DUF1049 family)
MVISAIAFVAGAIMYWALTTQSTATGQAHGFRLSTVGIILMIAGGVGFVVSGIVFSVSRRSTKQPSHTLDRQTTDSQGRSSAVHEEQH